MSGEIPVVVDTIAFGVGIDKADVRYGIVFYIFCLVLILIREIYNFRTINDLTCKYCSNSSVSEKRSHISILMFQSTQTGSRWLFLMFGVLSFLIEKAFITRSTSGKFWKKMLNFYTRRFVLFKEKMNCFQAKKGLSDDAKNIQIKAL